MVLGGFSLDAFYLHQEHWTDEDANDMTHLQQMTGYFESPLETQRHEEEYPVVD